MAISTVNGYIAAAKQNIVWSKTGTRTLVASMIYNLFGIAGEPGNGTEAAGNTANGIVPDDTIAGFPSINAFGGSNTGYLSRVSISSSVACRARVCDKLFACGAYNYNADTSLASIPSYSTRCPGTSYVGLEIWVETLVAPTGNLAVQVNYKNQANGDGDTGAVGIGGVPPVGRMWQLPLAAGDSGVQNLVRIRGSVATVGASCFNVVVLRPLTPWMRVKIANDAQTYDMFSTGMPQVYDTSALFVQYAADSTAVGLPFIEMEICNG